MSNFKIFDDNYVEPAPEPHYYAVGTSFSFREIGGQIKAAIQVPVVFA